MYQVYFSYNDEQVRVCVAEFKTMTRAKSYIKHLIDKNNGIHKGQGYHIEYQTN